MPDARGTTVQLVQYCLELEGVSMGAILSFAGGDATADVIVEKVGKDGIAHKHLAGVKYEDIRVRCDANMSARFYNWLQQIFNGAVIKKNGAIVGYTINGDEALRLSFFGGSVSEISFPDLDASSQDVAALTITISSEYTREDIGNSKILQTVSNRKKTWTSQNFRLTIDGATYARVSRIEAITIKRSVAPDGALSGDRNKATIVVVPDLIITLADVSSDAGGAALSAWYNSFVVEGNNGQQQEKNGTLEYLSTDLKTPLFTLDLRQLGVYRLTRLNDFSGNISRLQARFYCEQIVFSYAANIGVRARTQTSGSSSDNQTTLPTRNRISSPLVEGGTLVSAALGAESSVRSQSARAVPSAASRSPRNLTPAQGPLNQLALRSQTLVPSPQPRTSLVFRDLKPTLDRVVTDPAFRDRLERAPLTVLDELGVKVDAATRAELQGKRLSEFWAARRRSVEGPVESRELPPQSGALNDQQLAAGGGALDSVTHFAPPYVPVGP